MDSRVRIPPSLARLTQRDADSPTSYLETTRNRLRIRLITPPPCKKDTSRFPTYSASTGVWTIRGAPAKCIHLEKHNLDLITDDVVTITGPDNIHFVSGGAIEPGGFLVFQRVNNPGTEKIHFQPVDLGANLVIRIN